MMFPLYSLFRKRLLLFPKGHVRILWAFFAALILLLFNEQKASWSLLAKPFFDILLLINALMAMVIIELACRFNALLDQKQPWPHPKRFWSQFKYCLLFPLGLAVGLASLYLAALDYNMLETIHFRKIFLLVLLLLIAMNAIFFGHQVNLQTNSPKVSQQVNGSKVCTYSQAQLAQIAWIKSTKGLTLAYQLDGAHYHWSDTIDHSLSYLDDTQFFRVNRAMVVNRRAIASLNVISPKKTEISLLPVFGITVTVSARRNSRFKKWFNA